MKVSLATHGGLAAAVNLARPPEALDTDSLSETAAAELVRLVAAAASAPTLDEPGRARDAMSYTITVEEEGGRRTVLKQSDASMTPAFAALLAWLRQHVDQR
ncbi:protealysin inhibitor emfourin [Streptomyces sp. NPDC046685]|uniref:protealysin inhibitor emfourin n=1 Tax=Streptomyces sp. NPDC046685 TaxID=3157202 RepID=UPI0033F8C82C